jgi:hypothetical protein
MTCISERKFSISHRTFIMKEYSRTKITEMHSNEMHYVQSTFFAFAIIDPVLRNIRGGFYTAIS